MGCFDNIEKFREEKRYLNKTNTVGVRDMYSNIWTDFINMYGVNTTYYRHGYKLNTQDDFIYGEDPTEPFLEPYAINMIVEYETDALLLSKFGLESTADLHAVVSIKDYQNTFGLGAEPKAGDVIELTEAGWYTTEMPQYDGIRSRYNIVADIAKLNIPIVNVSVSVTPTTIAPVKRNINENILSYVAPMYTTNATIDPRYPIENELLPVSGDILSDDYLEIPLSGETYYSPLYTPVTGYEMPGIHSLYFDYNIVDLNGGDIVSAGYLPFEYEDTTLLLPLYSPATSAEPPVIIKYPAQDLSHIDLDVKSLICKHMIGGEGYDYINSILIELSAVYGSQFIRYPQLFEITEVKYQDFSKAGMNVAQGHYVWQLHAKRFDYSFEPGISSEGPNNQVYDNSFFGSISSLDGETSPDKIYPQDVKDVSDDVWDYENEGPDTGPYGYY
jgi:hypothetical protein